MELDSGTSTLGFVDRSSEASLSIKLPCNQAFFVIKHFAFAIPGLWKTSRSNVENVKVFPGFSR